MVGGPDCPGQRPGRASVGPDPRAGMVAAPVGAPASIRLGLQWGPTRGPGWSLLQGPALGVGGLGLQWGPTRGPGWSRSACARRLTPCSLQWGPTRGPGWSQGRRRGGCGRDRPASVGPDPRAGMVACKVGSGAEKRVVLQWGPTRGPGWSRPITWLAGNPASRLQWGPTRGPGWSTDRYNEPRTILGALQWGPTRGPGWSQTLAVGQRLLLSSFSGARPEGRDGRQCPERVPGSVCEGFSGARPEGRDGRDVIAGMLDETGGLQWGPTRGPGWSDTFPGLLEVAAGLQWGPTRGPGWSHALQFRLGSQPVASVGPDPRAGMVGHHLRRR